MLRDCKSPPPPPVRPPADEEDNEEEKEGLAEAGQGNEEAEQDEGMDGGDESLASPGKCPNPLC